MRLHIFVFVEITEMEKQFLTVMEETNKDHRTQLDDLWNRHKEEMAQKEKGEMTQERISKL